MATTYDIARRMVSQGFRVLPLKELDKAPARSGWRKNRSDAVASTLEQVERLWRNGESRSNVGIVLEPGMFVVDVDGKDGARQFRKLQKKFGKLPRTFTVKTTSGEGWHYYYKYDANLWLISNSNRGLALALGVSAGHRKEGDTAERLKIDVRGNGGQVVAPGCPVRYGDTGHEGRSKVTIWEPIAQAPDWLLEMLAGSQKPQNDFCISEITDHDYREVARALRHVAVDGYQAWVRIGMALHTTGRGDAFELFDAWSSTQPGYKHTEDCRKHWDSFRGSNENGALVRFQTIFYEAKKTGWIPSAPAIDLEELGAKLGAPGGKGDSVAHALLDSPKGYTDDTLAIRVANVLEGRCRYVQAWHRWMVWDGNRWLADTMSTAKDAVRDVLRAEAKVCSDIAAELREQVPPSADKEKLADALVKLAARLGKTKTLNDVMAQLVVERRALAPIVASHEIWDQEHEILNTPAGPYDLANGQLAANSMERYCSRSTSIAPSFEKPERFIKFLDEIFDGDQETIDFIHRYVGYAATGYTREECLLFAHGAGGNGKGVLFNAVYRVLGDYAKVVDPDMFTLAGSGQHKSALAALVGRRFILSQEIPENTHWNEARLKSLASGDAIEANFMRAEKFEFKPQGSIVICSNPKPAFRSVGDAVKRRFRFVSFTQSFVGRQDPLLPQALDREAPMILGWIIQGAYRYLQEGLKTPRHVELATQQYLDDADTLGWWLSEVTFADDDDDDRERHFHPLKEIVGSYNDFAKNMAVRSVGRSTLVDALREKGVAESTRTVARYGSGKKRYWGPVRLGIKLH